MGVECFVVSWDRECILIEEIGVGIWGLYGFYWEEVFGGNVC